MRLSTGVGGGKGPICLIVLTVSDAPKIFHNIFLKQPICYAGQAQCILLFRNLKPLLVDHLISFAYIFYFHDELFRNVVLPYHQAGKHAC